MILRYLNLHHTKFKFIKTVIRFSPSSWSNFWELFRMDATIAIWMFSLSPTDYQHPAVGSLLWPFGSQPYGRPGAPWWAWGPMVGYRGALEEACTDWPQICSITATPNSSSEDNREEVAAERRGHQQLPKNSKLGPGGKSTKPVFTILNSILSLWLLKSWYHLILLNFNFCCLIMCITQFAKLPLYRSFFVKWQCFDLWSFHSISFILPSEKPHPTQSHVSPIQTSSSYATCSQN